jgi:molybdate transport system ATP-binding protein
VNQIRRSLDVPLILVTHDFDDVLRLATHVLLLSGGRSVATGPVTEVMRRPDLSWLRDAVGLGSVFDATVTSVEHGRGLVELSFAGGRLLASSQTATPGQRVRVRVPAREVILAASEPTGLSVHNALRGVVTDVHLDAAFEHPIVQLKVGGTEILAEVTKDAVSRLGIVSGAALHALIKSVSVQMLDWQA